MTRSDTKVHAASAAACSTRGAVRRPSVGRAGLRGSRSVTGARPDANRAGGRARHQPVKPRGDVRGEANFEDSIGITRSGAG